MNKEKIRIVIADDQEIFRDGLKLVLSKCDNIELVGEAANGRALIQQVKLHQPHVVLADIMMPVMDGIAATREIQQIDERVRVIALSMLDEESAILDMSDAGAIGYLVKNADKEEIYAAIRNAYHNEPYYCSASAAQLAKMLTRQKKERAVPPVNLSERDLRLVRAICDELNNAEIAKEMHVAKRTVDGYRSSLMDKLHVRSAIGVVKWAVKNGVYKL